MDRGGTRREDPDPVGAALLGFAWAFASALLVCASGAVIALATVTHLLVRVRPSVTRVLNYDPSRVASAAAIPFALGLVLGWLYVRRLRRETTRQRMEGAR